MFLTGSMIILVIPRWYDLKILFRWLIKKRSLIILRFPIPKRAAGLVIFTTTSTKAQDLDKPEKRWCIEIQMMIMAVIPMLNVSIQLPIADAVNNIGLWWLILVPRGIVFDWEIHQKCTSQETNGIWFFLWKIDWICWHKIIINKKMFQIAHQWSERLLLMSTDLRETTLQS